MRKLLATLLLLCGLASGQSFFRLNPPAPGGVLRLCSVTDANPCNPTQPIFNDQALTQPITQPVMLGPDGNFGFWTQPGQYILQISSPFNRIEVLNLAGPPVTSGGGTGNQLALSVTPNAINFGTATQNVAAPSGPQPVTISNTGTGIVLISALTFNNPDFSTTSNCPSISPGASCVLLVKFTPSIIGAETGTLTIVSNVPPDILNPATANFTGTGTGGTTFALNIANLGTGAGNVVSIEVPPLINCNLSASAPPAGACAANYASGATPTLNFTPTGGGTLGTVTGCSVTAGSCTPTISALTTITVTFTAPVPTVSFSVAGTADQGIGTVTSDLTDVNTGAPINCTITAGNPTGTCTILLNQGAQPILTESPSTSCPGTCTFVAWGGAAGCTNGTTCQPTLNSNTTISADFALPAGTANATLIQTINGGTSGGSSPAFVKACQNFSTTSVTSITVTCSTTAGDLIVVMTRMALDQTTTWTVSDSASQSYAQTASGYTTSGTQNYRGGMHYKANSSALTSITVTFANSIIAGSVIVYELSGMATSSPEDSSINSNSGGATVTNLTSGALTTTNANDALVYFIAQNTNDGGTETPGTGYTLPTNGNSNQRAFSSYKIVAATQSGTTTNMTWASVTQPSSVFAGFKGSGASTTVTGNFASAQNQGDANFCSVNFNDNTTTVSSITDTSGNTYNQVSASPKAIAGVTTSLYEAHNIAAAAAGANTVTVTLSASPSVKKLNCAEYSGVITSAPGDGSAGATGTGTAIASGNLATTTNNDLVLGVDNVAGSLTAVAPGFVQRINGTSNEMEDKNPFATGTVNFQPTQGTAVNWAAIVAAFKTGGVAPQFIVTLSCPGNGTGTIKGSGFNATCNNFSPGGVFSIPVSPGAILSFTAVPQSPGSAFVSYNGGAGCANSPSCTTTPITQNTTIGVNFTLSGTNAFYVNPSTGSDTNQGTQASPWASFSKANSAFTLGAGGTVIHFANGTYASSVLLTRGGSSSSVRVAYQCDNGTAAATTAIGLCKVPGSIEVASANNIDIVGFDIGNNGNVGFAIDVDTDQTTGPGATTTIGNSFHLIGNYLHDVGINVVGNGITGCPQNGMVNIANHGGSPTDIQVIRNIVIRFGLWNAPPAGCNTASLICCHGNPYLIYDNIIGQAPVGGILFHDACRFAASNNVIFQVKSALYLGTVDGTCPFYGQNTFDNNYMFSMFGTSAVFHVHTNTCDATHPNLYGTNYSDNSKPDFDQVLSCETVTPSSFVHSPAATFLVNPVTNAPANTFTGDYHLKAGSPGILGGKVNNCVTGGTFPCTPSFDFALTPFQTASPMDVGAYKF